MVEKKEGELLASYLAHADEDISGGGPGSLNTLGKRNSVESLRALIRARAADPEGAEVIYPDDWTILGEGKYQTRPRWPSWEDRT